MRKEVFKQNYKIISDHNSKTGETYFMAVNHMTDWTHVEFMRLAGAKFEDK